MTAVLSPSHLFPPAGSFRSGARTRRPVPPSTPWAGNRPVLTVVTHVDSPPSAARYRLRRLVGLAVLVALAVPLQLGGVVVVNHVLSSVPATAMAPTNDTMAASSQAVAAPALPAVAGQTYVVRPGDTLWSIARRLQSDGDVRPLVDALGERAGGAALQPGQRLDLHGLGA